MPNKLHEAIEHGLGGIFRLALITAVAYAAANPGILP
jgi:hypothetical protein